MSHHDQGTVPPPVVVDAEPDADDLLLQIDIRLHLDEVAASEVDQLREDGRTEPTGRQLAILALKIYDARRLRDRMLPEKLFGEPAWDMLLALYGLPHRGELLTISALCYASGVPTTTALRWQRTLLVQGLIERGPQGVDRRKQFVRLTDIGRHLLEKYLTKLFYCDAPTPPAEAGN